MNPVWVLAKNTFREAVRDRILYNLVLFVILLSVSAIFLGAASASQDAKIIVDLGLSAMLLFGAFIAVFVGVGLVWKEIERRTVYAIFAKPVGRGEFLLGKYVLIHFSGLFTQLGYTFEGGAVQTNGRDGNANDIDVGGARDRYFGAMGTVGVLY